VTVSATGPLSLPLENLRTLLANSATFKTWVGAADVTAAKDRIYLAGVAGTAYTRPYAVVMQAGAGGLERVAEADGAAKRFIASGRLLLALEDDVPSDYQSSYADAELDFTNTIGAIISEMEALAGTSGFLAVKHIAIHSGPARSDADEKSSTGDYYQIVLEVEWGI